MLGSVVVGSVAWARSTGEWIILIGGAVSAVTYIIKTILRPFWRKLDAILESTNQVAEMKRTLDTLTAKIEVLEEARRDPNARTRSTDVLTARWEKP